MPDFNNEFRCCSNSEPSSIVKLHTIAVRHGNSIRKVEQQILAKIVRQSNATTMSVIKIKSKRAHCQFVRPMPGRPMNTGTRKESVDGSHINQYMK